MRSEHNGLDVSEEQNNAGRAHKFDKTKMANKLEEEEGLTGRRRSLFGGRIRRKNDRRQKEEEGWPNAEDGTEADAKGLKGEGGD